MNDADRTRRNPPDPFQPVAAFAEEEIDLNGRLAPGCTILLANRECPWRCIYCTLWKSTLPESVPVGAIPTQIDVAFRRLQVESSGCEWVKLYNAGSFFDTRAIPPEDYPAIAGRVKPFRRVIVECHPALMGDAVPHFRDLIAPARLEVAMGLETAHPKVLAKLNKGMTLERYARAGQFLREHGIDHRAFTLLQPPFLPDPTEALHWSDQTLEFALVCGAAVAVIIPTRPGASTLDTLAQQGLFRPPRLATLEEALRRGLRRRRGIVLADLWDLPQFADCPECLTIRTARLQMMNRQQKPASGEPCHRCGY